MSDFDFQHGEPLHDHVIVRRDKTAEEVRGGIIIPETTKEKPQSGVVLAVGPGRLNEDGTRTVMDVRVGDYVILKKYAGADVRIGEEEFVIAVESEVMFRFKPKKKGQQTRKER